MAKAKSRAAQIKKYLEKNPHVKASDVAKHLGVPAHAVYNVRWAMKKESPSEAYVAEAAQAVVEDTSAPVTAESIKAYNESQQDLVDWFVNKFGLDYNLGNAVKYIAMSDVSMAKKYLERAA
jgi:predicted transcriptional regulator